MSKNNSDIPVKVLLVDDTPANLKIMEVSIKRDNSQMEILTAESGEDALKIVMDHELALIISDVFMPGMNGHQFVEYLHKNTRTRNIPVIFVTAGNLDLKMEEEGYSAGAVDYLYKPINYKVLRAKVKVFVDLYVQKKQIEGLKKESEDVRVDKDDFIEMVSHEAMTPLNGILGMCDALQRTTLSGEQRNFVGTIHSSSHSIILLMRDLLDLAHVKSNCLELNHKSFSLSRLITENAGMWSPRIEDKRLRFYLMLGDNIFTQIVSDRQRIEQMTGHFLSNAMKYTVRGSVELYCNLELQGYKDGILEIKVTDTGSGISSYEIDNIFNPTKNISNNRKSVGLPLSSSLAKLMGGDITCESKKGFGSTFTLKIPVQLDTTQKDKTIPPDISRKAESLKSDAQIIVKDEKDGKSLASILKYYSIKSSVTVGSADSFSSNDIAFVEDDMLDETEAADVCKKVVILSRKGKVPRKSMSLEMLESKGAPKLLQPCSIQYLNEVFNQLTAAPKSMLSSSFAKKKKLDGKKILILDHNPLSQRVHKLMLSEMGMQVEVCRDIDSALKSLLSNSPKIDGVLVDCHYPVINSSDFTTQARIQEKTKNLKRIPIIGVTANNMPSFRDKCSAAGMDECINKPVNKYSLQAKLERLIQ